MRVYVRRLENQEIVKEIEVGKPSSRNHELMMMGLLRNMNTDKFYVDDSELDDRCSECGAYGGEHIYRDCPNRIPAGTG